MPAKKPKQAKPSRPKPYLVFVSHATADKYLAKMICEKVEAVNATYFRDDRDIGGGEDIAETIYEYLDSCDEFLILITPQSFGRPWVWMEFGAALHARKRIVS